MVRKRLVFTMLGVGMIFHLGAFYLTVQGLQAGLFELNPIMDFMFKRGVAPAFLLTLLVYALLAKVAWHKPYFVTGLAPMVAYGFDFANDLAWMWVA